MQKAIRYSILRTLFTYCISTKRPKQALNPYVLRQSSSLFPSPPFHHHHNQHLPPIYYPRHPLLSLPLRQHPAAWERDEEVQFGIFIEHILLLSPDQHLTARVRPTFMAAECERLEGRGGWEGRDGEREGGRAMGRGGAGSVWMGF